MKHYIMITLSLLMIAFAATAWAETVSIEDTDKTFTFVSSPSTDIHEATTDTQFYIGAASTKTTAANGMEYAMTSQNGNLYQKTQDTEYVVDTDGAADEIPSDNGFSVRGGS